MKTFKGVDRKLSVGLFVLALVLGATISCSKDDDDDGPGPGDSKTVKIQGFAYSPGTITVSRGTSVQWTNLDEVAHTVTSDDGFFDSGLIDQNGTYSHTFDSTGTFDYHCTPHPNMTASVVVN